MTITHETLSAYLDGELSSADMQAVEAALETDPELAIQFADIAEANEAMTSAYRPLADEPIPDHILAMVKAGTDDSNVVSLAEVKSQSSFSRWLMPIAASLAMVLGFAVGTNVNDDTISSDALYAQLTGSITQDSPLFDILEGTPSAQSVGFQGAADVLIEPLMTFQAANGVYCREVRIESPNSAQKGVVCRDDEIWNIVLLTQVRKAVDTPDFRTASGNSDNYIDEMIDDLIIGIPLDLDAEASAMKQGWTLPSRKSEP